MPTASSVFVDTSGWAEPLVRNSPDHDALERYYRLLIATQRSLITTNDVLAELVALLTVRSRFTRPQVLAISGAIKQMTSLRLVYVDQTLDAAAWALLHQYADKQWSLVDAASFVVMRQLGISEAFTTDQHFLQAGFVRVPVQ